MICISINQESRRLALFDMFNAARQCDLLEVRLDRFGKSPEIGELLANKPKPVIMSCRRAQDGGFWDGSEEERLALLRQCIISKADYVEIELDVADQVRRFPPSQRVITYTNLQETPEDILDIYEQALAKNPDVVKLVTRAQTPEEAWPLVQIVAKQRVPTVVVGLGKPGVMLSVLGKKIGAPWTYAALEKGMEAYPGQATVSDLREVYHYPAIGRATRLIGVTGFGPPEVMTVAALNAALAHLELPARCLPVGVGDVRLFRKVVEAVKLAAVVIGPEHRQELLPMATELQPSAQNAGTADLLLRKGDGWSACSTTVPAQVHALAEALRPKFGEHPLRGRMVVIVGLTGPAKSLAGEIQRHGGSAILASHLRKAGLQMAQEVGCRAVQFEAIYSTMHDVLVVCDEEKQPTASHPGGPGLHPGYLKAGMTVMDLTAGPGTSLLLREAKARGCVVVDTRQLLIDQLEMQARLITGKHVPREVIEKPLATMAEEE